MKKTATNSVKKEKKTRVSQADIPSVSLKNALRIADAICNNYAGHPSKPLDVARAMGMLPTTGSFRMMCGASIAYGLTVGGYGADAIELTPLALRILRPTTEGDDAKALQEALLTPRVTKDFLQKYNGHALPPNKQIALNVLEQEMNVPSDSVQRVYNLITEGAGEYGLLKDIKGRSFVDINPSSVAPANNNVSQDLDLNQQSVGGDLPEFATPSLAHTAVDETGKLHTPDSNNRVFITHGKNTEIVAQLRELLRFGKFDPVISVDRDTVSKPVPDKVLDDMRSCSAAIIHVGSERRVLDDEGKEHVFLNPNVLIEIGAAMALYQRKFVLLVEEGVTLPSNLQGLYEVRYKGGNLDYEATMKLLRTFNELKN